MPTNLVRLGAVYKYRARIPQDLLAHYAPQREVMVSLHTKSLTEARRRLLPAAQQKYQDEWHQVRQLLALQRACNSKEGMSITDDSIQYYRSPEVESPLQTTAEIMSSLRQTQSLENPEQRRFCSALLALFHIIEWST